MTDRPAAEFRRFAGLMLLAVVAGAAEHITLLSDFEDGLGAWRTEGDAFGVSVVAGDRWQRRGSGRFCGPAFGCRGVCTARRGGHSFSHRLAGGSQRRCWRLCLGV